MSYFRTIGPPARLFEDFVETKSAKSHKFTAHVVQVVSTRITEGFQLSCGHFMRAAKCAGKKRFRCYLCEWVDEGTHAHLASVNQDKWVLTAPESPGAAD